jgi:hypothetical protein
MLELGNLLLGDQYLVFVFDLLRNLDKGIWIESTKQKMRHVWPGGSCTMLSYPESPSSEIGVTMRVIGSTKQGKLLEESWLSFGESKNVVPSLNNELQSLLVLTY